MKIAYDERKDMRKSPVFGEGCTVIRVLDCTDDEDGETLAIFRDLETAKKAVAALWPDAEIVE